MQQTESLSLRPDRSLLNSDFECYRLSLDRFLIRSHELNRSPFIISGSNESNFNRLKALSLHNGCTASNNGEKVFYVDERESIHSFALSTETFSVVFSTDASSPADAASGGSWCPSLKILSNDVAVFITSRGLMHVLNLSTSQWSQIQRHDFHQRVVLLDARISPESTLNILVLQFAATVEDIGLNSDGFEWKRLDKAASRNLVVLRVLRFDLETATLKTPLKEEILIGKGVPEFCRFVAPNAESVIVASEHCFYPPDEYLSRNQEEAATETNGEHENGVENRYFWHQSLSEVTVTVPGPVAKENVECTFGLNCIALSVAFAADDKRAPMKIDGEVFGNLDVEGCLWTIEEDGDLRLHLTKAEEGFWEFLVANDDRAVHQNEETGQSEGNGGGAAESQTQESGGFVNLQNQEEDCDRNPSNPCTIQLISLTGELRIIAQTDFAAFEWLFSIPAASSSSEMDRLCLRHDVDGIVWNFEGGLFHHIGTFDAAGYVLASRINKRFAAASSEMTLCGRRRQAAFVPLSKWLSRHIDDKEPKDLLECENCCKATCGLTAG